MPVLSLTNLAKTNCQHQVFVKIRSNRVSYSLLVGVNIGTVTLENLTLSSKVVDGHTLYPTVPVYPRESLAHGLQEISIRMF